MFDFEAEEMDSHGAPSAPLHVSDVTAVSGEWQLVGVSGTNMVTVRSTSDANATSNDIDISLNVLYALAADVTDPPNDPVDGQARVIYDDTAPTAVVPAANAAATPDPIPYPLRAVSLSSDFAAPEVDENTVWDEDFYLRVAIDDDETGGGVEFAASMVSFDKAGMLSVVQVGRDANQAGNAAAGAGGSVYLIHIRLLPNRVTSAGEEVVIIITPVDRSGNAATAPARQTVKLAAKAAPTPQPNRPPNFGANTIPDISAQATLTAINVTLPAAVDPDSGDTLTYSITPALPAGIMFNATTRVLSGTPTAMMAQTAYTYTATDGDSETDTIMFNITINAAPPNRSAVITIQPRKFRRCRERQGRDE